MITCPTCANRMVTYPNDWRICPACSIFDHAIADVLESRRADDITAAPWPAAPAAATGSR